MNAKDKRIQLAKPKKDYLGQLLKIGDEVIYINPYYRDLSRGIIVKFTPLQVKIQVVGSRKDLTLRFPLSVIKINKNE